MGRSTVGAAGGRDYPSLTAWEDYADTASQTTAEEYIAECYGICGAMPTIVGWATGSTCTIESATGERHDGKEATSGAYVSSTWGTYAQTTGIDVTFRGMANVGNADNYDTMYTYTTPATDGGKDIIFEDCLIQLQVDDENAPTLGSFQRIMKFNTTTGQGEHVQFRHCIFRVHSSSAITSGSLNLIDLRCTSSGSKTLTIANCTFNMDIHHDEATNTNIINVVQGGSGAITANYRSNVFAAFEGDIGTDIKSTGTVTVNSSDNFCGGNITTATSESTALAVDDLTGVTNEAFDMTPAAGSILIDAGDENYAYSSDILGTSIPQGSEADAGAIEKTASTAAVTATRTRGIPNARVMVRPYRSR